MLSAAGVALLSFSVRAQEVAGERLGDLAELRRASALLAGDLGQAAPRLHRDERGAVLPAFRGSDGGRDGLLLSFVRRGWENVADAPRSSLQKLDYRLEKGRLERVAYPRVDGSAAGAPAVMIEGVRRLRVRYRDREGEWRDRWDPANAAELPLAVELVLDAEGSGTTRQLFIAGGSW